MAVHPPQLLSPVSLASQSAGLLLGLRARLAGGGFDARLAAGEDPAGDPALAVRAVQLTRPRARMRFACGLERVCSDSRPRAAFSSAIPVNYRAVGVARPALGQLSAALRDREAVDARGVALAQAILTDLTGPLYRPAAEDALCEATREALLALSASGRLADEG
jgi:hypothetical protein